MRLREFFAEDAITLQLQSTTKDDDLKELVGLLQLDDKSEQTLVKMLKRRETLGSTGIGQNIAIPHCRALAVNRLRVAFGRKLDGIDFNAIDGKPLLLLFLLVRLFALGPIAAAGIVVVAALLAYEHSILSPRDMRRMNAAFFTLNGVISIAFF